MSDHPMHDRAQAGTPGFTLVEILIAVAIIGFLMAAVLVAVDPVKRIQDSRDARRATEANAILNAMLTKQLDDRQYYDGVGAVGAGGIDTNATTVQVIARTACPANCTGVTIANTCPGAPTGSTISTTTQECCAVMSGLASGYIGELPLDPLGDGKTPTGALNPISATNTGYYITRGTAKNALVIGACWPEQITPQAGAIKSSR